MAELSTDEEKVEAIKKWWKENGTAVVAGVVIGLGLVFGWRAWTNHQTNVGQRASLAFEQVLMATASGQAETAAKQAQILGSDYGDTPYAALSELALAKALIDQDDLSGAAQALRKAIDGAPDPSITKLAAFRLARVQIALGELDSAAKVVDNHDDGSAFSGDFAGLRGDIAAAKGDVATARAEYQKAIDAGAGMARLLELKLQDLPATDAS